MTVPRTSKKLNVKYIAYAQTSVLCNGTGLGLCVGLLFDEDSFEERGDFCTRQEHVVII